MPLLSRLRTACQELVLLAAALAIGASGALAQVNGRLQIHFMNVGQADAAILISPRGQTVLFDVGENKCHVPLGYLSGIGVTAVDYMVVSHFHKDHIGCTTAVLKEVPVRTFVYDRGMNDPPLNEDGTDVTATYRDYQVAVGSKRRRVIPGESIRLDSNTPHPVTITFMVADGAAPGILADVNNENDRSVVALVHFGQFDAVLGGDLSGKKTGDYRNVESRVASVIGPVELYKVSHHGSGHSSNADWLRATTPIVGIISAGVQNKHKHPTKEALARLHAANVRTYWTTTGMDTTPPRPGFDFVGNNIIVEFAHDSAKFKVTYAGNLSHEYYVHGATPADATSAPPATYVWSALSGIYHVADCSYVQNISAVNRRSGSAPPAGKRLHDDCPRHGDHE
jgi:beta-lactamase superfamily II metal-dependent hydrolase